MIDYMKIPVVLINNYLWDLASGSVTGNPKVSSAVWNVNSYSYQPFYPVHENTAPESSTTPYVLYDFLFEEPDDTFWPLHKEKAIYSIVGDIPQIFYVKNFIFESLKKFDKSAQEVNNHINDSSINFKCIHVYQDNFISEEKRIDSFKPKYITTLTLTYDYTK
ncbi:MAG: hypothetical protein EB127_14140 [Alphaproteobacteria bacterium]|nr:hypothetical protein [Alphaproteobacteria bacterium]